MDKTGRPVYPTMDIKQCPNCGGTRFLADEVLQRQKEAKKLPKESKAYISQHQSVVAGRPGTWLSAPMIRTFFEVCVDCGTYFCIHADVHTVIQGGQKLPDQPGLQLN